MGMPLLRMHPDPTVGCEERTHQETQARLVTTPCLDASLHSNLAPTEVAQKRLRFRESFRFRVLGIGGSRRSSDSHPYPSRDIPRLLCVARTFASNLPDCVERPHPQLHFWFGR